MRAIDPGVTLFGGRIHGVDEIDERGLVEAFEFNEQIAGMNFGESANDRSYFIPKKIKNVFDFLSRC